MQAIKSAGSGMLTTPGLEAFKKLLEQASKEHALIVRDLVQARQMETVAIGKYTGWNNGWLLRRLFKAKFAELGNVAQLASERRQEIEEQEKLSKLQTQMDLPEGVKRSFHSMRDEFDKVARSNKIWDTVSHRGANRVAERTTASRIVDRKQVSFGLGTCEPIEFESTVPHLANANGGDLYLYPAFVVYFVTASSFALLEYNDIAIEYGVTRFIEEEDVPADARVVDKTWAKANKDGSPDRRFSNNYQIPVAEYGRVVLRSRTGLDEEYILSNAYQTALFAASWTAHVRAIVAGV